MAKKYGKKYEESLAKVDRHKLYSVREAFDLMLDTATANFDETVDLSLRLGVDPKHADQQVRGAVVLPNGTGRDVTVAVVAKGDKEAEAKEAGAEYVGGDDLIEKIQEGWFDFDVLVATPDMMGSVGRVGRFLGPKGLMPNPKSGTVTMDVGKAVEEIKAGKVEYRVDKSSIINVPIGKVSFGSEKLIENFRAIMTEIIAARPAAIPAGRYLRSVTISSTMGPGVKINGQRLMEDD